MIKIYHNGELLEVSEPGDVLINWSKDADPIFNFIDDYFIESKDEYDYSKLKMFDMYKQWYIMSGLDERRMITSEKSFTVALQPYFTVADKQIKRDAKSPVREKVRVYRGEKKLKNLSINLEPDLPQTKIE